MAQSLQGARPSAAPPFLQILILSGLTSLALLSGITHKNAIATTRFEVNADGPAEQFTTLVSGPVKVLVTQKKSGDRPEYTLNYEVFYKDEPQLNATVDSWQTGTIELQDLDQNNLPEVIVSTYSGGAHCCTEFTIHGWQHNQFVTATTGPLNADGGVFQDLNGDRKPEFVSVDNAFLYAFSSYAGSFAPSLIYAYEDGALVNVTHRFPKVLSSHAWQMYQRLLSHQQDKQEINGTLAGYVAQKILLGEYQQGWDFMLKHYDRGSDWGLDIYQGDKVTGKHPNFPTALKALLIQTGYLDSQGQPVVQPAQRR